ncbi:MAG: acetylornithine carbamoyltransferase [Flavobacteriales bacterium]|nr:acetylornithine carbamoyltransferase [Flavobacteriales bacterium]|tara:strand:+ start:5492 stop:6442 length:951 start_codon:yes stop_codon:yes gene_type:complete
MENFFSIKDVKNLQTLLGKALEVKENPLANKDLGKNKTLGLIFYNSSLRTRISSQKAAYNLGMDVIVLNIGSDGWELESKDGVVMDKGTAEHIKEAAGVISEYVDVIGIRCFAALKDCDLDYSEEVLQNFIRHATVPVVNLESSTLHPLQSLADLITIQTNKTKPRPKVVLTWAPHPRALPQAVANSFLQWMKEADVELVITHPKGYELAPEFNQGIKIEYDQKTAFKDADFIYAKNWSSYEEYGQILSKDSSWCVNAEKMAVTNNAKFMHCLPVRRNVVVSDEVIDSENSLVIEQAGNRVVSIQTVLQEFLKNKL